MLRFVSDLRNASGQLSRREWLRIGGLAGLGLLTAGRANGAPERAVAPGFGRARSVLLVYTSGGMSQIDTWDPKPDAPEEVRGLFQPTAMDQTSADLKLGTARSGRARRGWPRR